MARSTRRVAALLVGAVLVLTGCGSGAGGGAGSGAEGGAAPSPAAAPTVVRIAAASDLKFALDEVAAEFEKANPSIDVQPTYGSSGQFRQQIAQGAPFDLYLSADIALARELAVEGLAAPEDVFAYAVGRLVVWAPTTSPVDPTTGLPALLNPAAAKVAIANPEHAPYGRAAVAAMRSAGVYDQVAPRLVLGENIAQTAEFVASGNAEVGVIALSLALAPNLANAGRYAEVPLESFPRLDQGGVILTSAQDPAAARAVRDYLVGGQGVEILKRFGFYQPGS